MSGLPAGVDPMALVRRYEPVVRYTEGERFFPMSVDAYVREAALWAVDPATGREAVLVTDHRQLDLDLLCREARTRPDVLLELRYVPGALTGRERRQWRRDPHRVRFKATSRFAAVGLLGRLIDSLFRLSLVLRGRVPGGLTAAAHREYHVSPAALEFPYYAHVSTDAGYVVLQYWFFYAMNDWRSSFAGVNDHEGDWEQVTLYLTRTDDAGGRVAASPDGADVLSLQWVAFSSHDVVGSDLRRRHDDPDIGWVDGTHPVVYAGAGSHSGAYLPGEYLIRVEPPALERWFAAMARVRELLFPWTRGRPHTGLGIPYVDYKRGDGVEIGPGTQRAWTPVLVDGETPWVRDYQGLWGLDTDDPLGGERAPAGPRYERSGAVRESWSDPAAWAGLDPVPPTAAERERDAAERQAELGRRRAEIDAAIEAQQRVVRRAAAGVASLPRRLTSTRRGNAVVTAMEDEVRRLREMRAQRRTVASEEEHLQRAREEGPVVVPPHAHLQRRAVPDVDPLRPPGLLLRIWTEVSLSLLLALLGIALLLEAASTPFIVIAVFVTVMTVEAMLRRRLPVFLLGLGVVVLLVVVVWLLVTNWQFGVGALALFASGALAVANVRSLLSRR